MVRKLLWIFILLITLTGCGAPAPTATPAPATLPTESQPSPTSQPPETAMPSTATSTAPPELPPPTATVTPLPPTETATATEAGTATPNIFYGSSDYNKHEGWATLKLVNNSGKDVSVKIGGPNFYTYISFTIDTLIEVPWGNFWYEAYIGDKGPINGGFSITNSDKHTLIFEGNKIRFLVP